MKQIRISLCVFSILTLLIALYITSQFRIQLATTSFIMLVVACTLASVVFNVIMTIVLHKTFASMINVPERDSTLLSLMINGALTGGLITHAIMYSYNVPLTAVSIRTFIVSVFLGIASQFAVVIINAVSDKFFEENE